MKCFIFNSVLAAGLMLFSVASYGQTQITSVPYTITAPGRYIFANNLTYSAASGHAIFVVTSHVTIDLNGYYLSCPTPGNTAIGIEVGNEANVKVRNGGIGGFSDGVKFGAYASLAFENVVEGIQFWANSQFSVLSQGNVCVVQNCQIKGPGAYGIYFSAGGSGNRATNNVASGLTTGFVSGGSNYLDSNYADDCSLGISATSDTKLRFNTTTNCTTGVSGGTSEDASDQ
jgi:hypothetical protein